MSSLELLLILIIIPCVLIYTMSAFSTRYPRSMIKGSERSFKTILGDSYDYIKSNFIRFRYTSIFILFLFNFTGILLFCEVIKVFVVFWMKEITGKYE